MNTLGCKANLYDTMLIKNQLKDHHIEFVPFKEQADIYIINTCTVTNNADAQSRQLIRKAKRQAPHSVVIVTGCYTHVDEKGLREMAEVDYIFNNQEKDQIALTIGSLFPSVTTQEHHFLTDFDHKTRPFLKIQDGCHSFCSYCVIPYARTMMHSMKPQKVIEQIKHFSDQGYKEVVLTGIHLGFYGEDLDQKTDLYHLLKQLDQERVIERIRISSIDPHEITPELIQLIKESEIIQPHLHIALQYGEDTILKRMRRRDRIGVAIERIQMARKEIPNLFFGFDIIVGFPGESDQIFQTCINTLNILQPDYLHVFPYSKRPFTQAAQFDQQVHGKIIKKRAKTLRTLSMQFTQNRYKREIGSIYRVLIEQSIVLNHIHYLMGHTDHFLPVLIPNAQYKKHQFVTAQLNEVVGDYLVGSVV